MSKFYQKDAAIRSRIIAESNGHSGDKLRVVRFQHINQNVVVPALDAHLIVINFGDRIEAAQRADGKFSKKVLRTGDVSLIPAGLETEWHWRRLDYADFLQLYLSPSLVGEIAESAGINLQKSNIVNHFGVTDRLLTQIGFSLNEELKKPLPDKLYFETAANFLAVHLLRKYNADAIRLLTPRGGLTPVKLRRATDFIREKFHINLTVSDIAAEIGMSSFHFTRLFKQTTGLAPYQYIIERRIELAERLLKNNELTVTEIAYRVGFNNHSQFSEQFRRKTGHTPSEYRKISDDL